MKGKIAVLLALGLLPWVQAGAQQTASATFKVTARVNAVCQVAAGDLAFGTYSQATGTNGSVALQANCTPGATYYIGLDQGQSPGATVNARKMVSGAATLDYQLYSDSARTKVWGNTIGIDTVPGSGTGLTEPHTVFGAIPGAQNAAVGDYADTIVVRIYY